MFSLADAFAYFYVVDLPTLDLVIQEACRIHIERRRKAAQEASGSRLTVGPPRSSL
jgi:hypothetical protein